MELQVRIKKNLRDFVLDAEFSVKDEVFALLGASGCGKSMTLKCVAGIERPDEGHIILNGRTLFDSTAKINLPPQSRRVGYLFQNYALFPNMTVAENILFAAVGSQSEKLTSLRKNLEQFNLVGLENSYPAQLSGGQQQRVALARILSSNAEILLLDEPFSALDSYLKWQLELEMLEVFKSYDNSAILVSHDRGEVYRLSDKVAVMNRGKFESIDVKREVFKNPRNISSAMLTGCKNFSALEMLDDDTIFASDWQLKLKVFDCDPKFKFVGLRSHFLEYRTYAGENTFPMEVARVVEDTFTYLVMVRPKATDAKLIRWEVDKKFWQSVQAQELFLHFPPEKLILLEG